MTAEKITPRHLSRKAIVYVRQSTAQQLAHNEESRRLQYAMQDKLRSLGWGDIEVIDDDLGRSAAGTVERSGFQRMVAAVSLGQVGAVAARELSRFARNSHDWQQLIEVCRFVDTLLIDHDAIYDPRQSNDRLLLGLKGSMSEYELELIRTRSLEARRAKALRGEYIATPAVGYLKNDEGRLEKDPDLRVQEIIRLIFDKCIELGSVRQALLWFSEHNLDIPVSRRSKRRIVVWKRATYCQFHHVVTNPLYAGAYAFGKTTITHRIEDGQPRRSVVRRPMAEWTVLQRDHHDGYVSWDEFERIQKMIKSNASLHASSGAPKKGSALLSGLIRCRRCGRKLLVNYSGERRDVRRYECSRAQQSHGEKRCINFSAVDVDERVSELILDVVQPAAIDAAILASTEERGKGHDAMEALKAEIEAAQYAADRAWRQFDASDPENRLVTGELERRYETALARVREIETRLSTQEQSIEQRSVVDRETLISLAQDLGAVWHHSATDQRLKKRIVRTLIEELIADVDEQGREIVLLIHWTGGVHTELRIAKRQRGKSRRETSVDVINAIRELALICTDQEIAAWLGRAGIQTVNNKMWSKELIASYRSNHRIPRFVGDTTEWTALGAAATEVGVAWLTLRRAIERGELTAKHPLPNGPWIVKRSDVLHLPVVRRLQKQRSRGRKRGGVPSPGQLPLGIPKT